MRVLDGACMVYDSVGGVQPQSETVWRQANKYKVPRLAFVNKMDRVGANFFKVYDQMKSRLKANPVPIQVPDRGRGQVQRRGRPRQDEGDLWDDSTQGMKYEMRDIPADLVDVAKEWREKMVESAAEANEELMNKYLEGDDFEPPRRSSAASACERSPARSCRCSAAPRSRTRACRRCSTP